MKDDTRAEQSVFFLFYDLRKGLSDFGHPSCLLNQIRFTTRSIGCYVNLPYMMYINPNLT